MDDEMIDRMVRIAVKKLSQQDGVYTHDDAIRVLRYYFGTYHTVFGRYHPMPTLKQITDAVSKMPLIQAPDGTADIAVYADDYDELIDAYFCTRFAGNCDYGISHFFSGNVRYYRYREVYG